MQQENGHVEADGSRIRHRSAGEGAPLVHLHGAGGLELTPADELLARGRRVVALELPPPGGSRDLARTMLEAVTALGIETFDLLGTSTGAEAALRMAGLAPERVSALVLEAPAAIRPEGHPDRDTELEEAMRALQVPVLVVLGTRDPVIPPELGRVYRRLLPNCHLLLVYDAGHAIAVDRPEAFTEAVADFLAHREQYVVNRRGSVLFP